MPEAVTGESGFSEATGTMSCGRRGGQSPPYGPRDPNEPHCYSTPPAHVWTVLTAIPFEPHLDDYGARAAGKKEEL